MRKPEVRVYPPGYGHRGPVSDYQPWESDQHFLTAWQRVRHATMLDLPRLYELWELTAEAAKVPGCILEVGTWRGGSAALMGLRMQELDPGRSLIVADTFAGVAKAGPRDPYYSGGEHADTSLDSVSAFLHSLALPSIRLLSGVFPDETAHEVPDGPVALCHIDVDVYESARDVCEWVLPRIPRGGIMVFDDYGFYGTEGVTAYVHELRERRDCAVIANVNGHAIVVITDSGTH